jgi:tight adherence protein C
MFLWLIPLLAALAVYLLAVDFQRRIRAAQVQRRALDLVRVPEPGAVPTRKRRAYVESFFQWLPILARPQAGWVPAGWAAQMEKKLAQVPRWQGRPAAQWLAAKEAAAAAGLVFGVLVGLNLLWVAGLGLAGFWLPDLWLREWDRARRRELMRELPDLLDLLSSCIEAGLGFEPALAVILERGRPGRLRVEFQETMRLIRMGRSRRDALSEMALRVGEQDFSTFISALVQAERLGVGIGETLKIQAAALRTKRSQQIEKLALEAPVKLLFPLVVFIFPVVFLILFGPILIRFLQGF